MLSSRLHDTTGSCDIVKRSLLDDLYPYTVSADGSTIRYSSSSPSPRDNQPILYNQLDSIGSLAIKSYSEINTLNDCWLPVFVDDDTYIKNKLLSDEGSYANGNPGLASGRIGIENFISFNPSFRSFSNVGKMSIDWILNRHNIPYAVYYGIMCWVRRTGVSNPMVIGGAYATLESFANGTRLKHSSRPNDILIKIDNNTLYVVNSERYAVSATGFAHIDENKFILKTDTLKNSYALADKTIKEEWLPKSTSTYDDMLDGMLIGGLTNKAYLWIPDGDCIFYYSSNSDKLVSEIIGVPTNGFVSPCLTRHYTNIYRILTLDEVRSFARKDLVRARCYRKLAHSLSTSPFIGEFAIRALDCPTIKNIVADYIGSSKQSNSIETEKTLLKKALKDISMYLQNTIFTGNGTSNNSIYIDTKPSPYTLNNNLISNRSQLFGKLITKYGANLLLSGVSTIRADNSIFTDNAGVVITQAVDYYCSKNTSNTLLYNNQTIVYDSTAVETNISPTESSILIKNANSSTIGSDIESIPLYDIAKPDIDGKKTLFQPKLRYKGYIEAKYMSTAKYQPENNDLTYYKYAMKTESYIDISGEVQILPNLIAGDTDGPELDAMDLWLNVRDQSVFLRHDAYIENQMSFYWEKIAGPEFEFIDSVGGVRSAAKAAKETAMTRFVRLKLKTSGKYVVQCTINSPYGTFRKQKTIYVYDGADLMERRVRTTLNTSKSIFVNNVLRDKWYDDTTKSWLDIPVISKNDPEFIPIAINTDGLRVRCSKFNRIAISQIGSVVMPISTSFTVRQTIGRKVSGPPETEVVKLDELYKFATRKKYIQSSSANLAITYRLQNTIAKISAIYIEKLRSNLPGCDQCFSLYEPKLRSFKTPIFTGSSRVDGLRYERINKSPGGFSLYKYKNLPGTGLIEAVEVEQIPFGYPVISTASTPPVKTYGGYTNQIINGLGIENNISSFYPTTIPGLPSPSFHANDLGSISATQPSILPIVSGFPLDSTNDADTSKHKLCYQRQIPYSGGGPITFSKGVLHPNSGWIPYTSQSYAIHANTSSVLKFNPGARSSFSFVGPKISSINTRLTNISTSEAVIEPNILSSSISLRIADGVQWDPECFCKAPDNDDWPIKLYNRNQERKEYADTTTHRSSHGYRYLPGGSPKQVERTALLNLPTTNDEFGIQQDGDSITYAFAVTGPASLPSEVMGSDGRKHIRIPTVENFGIKDIEVKLNFFNYVNTKNLVIWLEVNPDGTEGQARKKDEKTDTYPSPIKAPNRFWDQSIPASMVSGSEYNISVNTTDKLYSNIPNQKIAEYIDMLFNTENDSPGGPLRLVLLNQEHIDNNGYNFSVKFSDNASKYNVLYDHNICTDRLGDTTYDRSIRPLSIIDKYQKIIKTHDMVRPSLVANQYSDREACHLSKILKANKLNTTVTSFSKFYTNSLFKSAAPEFGPCPDRTPKVVGDILNGKTTFTLKIMVLDETDDMQPNDTLISNQYLTGIATSNKVQTCPEIFNSLCNWELILHVGETQNFVPHTNPSLSSYGNCDALSLLDYKKNLRYPGYSFMADLSQYLHLLPLANMDAPNIAITDSSTCITDKDDPVGGGIIVKPTEFPSYAIMQIMSSLIPSTTGTIIGTATAPGIGYNAGFSALIGWMAENRFINNILDESGRQIYTQSYTKYPYGSPEKILLNVRKPGSLWYSLEAVIMKYHNTPILQPQKYNYIKVQRGVSEYATEFNFSVVTDYQQLLDLQNVPKLELDCADIVTLTGSSVSKPIIKNNLIINHGDLINVAVTGSSTTTPNCSDYDGLYVTLDTGWTKVTDSTLGSISKTMNYLKNNAVLFYGSSIFTDTLQTDISSSRVILSPTRIPYDIFAIGDTVECYAAADRLSDSSSITRLNILKKGLITKDNTMFSVFVVDTVITNQNKLSPTPETNTFLVYTNNTTVDNGVYKQHSAWGLDSQGNVRDTAPSVSFSAHSVGSYGNLSPFVSKNLLDKNLRYNHLKPVHDLVNNQDNDQIKYNKIKLYSTNTANILSEVPQFTNSISCGFSYSEEDISDLLVYQTNTENITISPENIRQAGGEFEGLSNQLLAQIKNTTGPNDKHYSFMYLRTSYTTSVQTPVDVPLYGMLTIENSFVEHTPIEFIDIQPIVSRLDTIESIKIQPKLEVMIGDPQKTSQILQSSNIHYLRQHLDRLTTEDPSSCYRQGASITDCPKLNTQNQLNKLYAERNELSKLLDQQAVAFASVAYIDDDGNRQNQNGEILAENDRYLVLGSSSGKTTILKSSIINTDSEYGLSKTYTRKDNLVDSHIHKLSKDILPKLSPIITTAKDKSLSVQYVPINLHHYWINIDPKQSCFLDFASNPKILESTEYRCIRANQAALGQFQTIRADNNVCPDFANREKTPQLPKDPIGDEGLSIEILSIPVYTYTIPSGIVETNKARLSKQYPAITGWSSFTKQRFFNINADNSLGLDGTGTEITVESTEKYLIPEINDTISVSDLSGDVLSAPSAINECQPNTNLGSPAGFGLLGPGENDRRIGKSIRVQNIFNLDNINNIEVQIKRVPRMLRGCDLLGTIYRYGNRSLYRPQSSTNPRIPLEIDLMGANGTINNSLYCWICLQHDPVTKKLKYSALPPFFQHQNEMMFRSLFGSIDRIENRSDLMMSYYPWELIPYEYTGQ